MKHIYNTPVKSRVDLDISAYTEDQMNSTMYSPKIRNHSKLSLHSDIKEARPLTSGKVRDPMRTTATQFYQDNLDVRLAAPKRSVSKFVPKVGVSCSRIPVLLGREAKLKEKDSNGIRRYKQAHKSRNN